MTKKVLFIATVTGHIISFHIPYLKWFKENGYEVHVASYGDKEIKYCDKHYNLQFARFPLKLRNIKVYKQLKKIINENDYYLIHCHTPTAGVLGRLAAKNARKRGTKVMYTAHGFHFYKGAPLINWLIYYPIEKFMSKYTDCLITITNEDYELAKKKFKKVKQIEHVNGVGFNTERLDIPVTEQEKQNIKQEFNIKENDIVLSYIAELNKNKNQILLINTVEELKKTNQNIKLLLIGNGPLKDYYQKIIENKNLQDNIKLLGRRADIGALLSLTNIYVASSIREGLPVNVMEAMYMKLPIVATDNRGHRELVKNGENGYIIKSFNYMEFSNKIKEIIEKNTYTLGSNSRKMAEKYSITNIMETMKKIYRSE